MNIRTVLAATSLTSAVLASTLPLEAATFTGVQEIGGYIYSARATFTENGPYLDLLIENTGAQVGDPGQVLTCAFFDLAGYPTLAPHAASVGPGSVVLVDNVAASPATVDLNDEWAFRSNLGANQWGNAHYGAGATGLGGVFGPGDVFAGHANGRPGGVDFGIVPLGGTASQGGLRGREFIQNGVLLQFSLPDGYRFDESSVSNVWFQYGTSPGETSVQAVPEPCMLGALGFAFLAVARRRRR